MIKDDLSRLIPLCSEPEIAAWYATSIRYAMADTDWPVVNAAITKAHSQSYLVRVKKRAWKIIEMCEASAGSKTA